MSAIAPTFLYRHVRIQPGRTIDVDVIGAAAAAAVGRGNFSPRPGARRTGRAAGRVAQRTELDTDLQLAAVRPRAPRNQQLVVAGSIEVSGIEQRDAGVERCVNGGDALGLVSGTVASDMPIQPRPSTETWGPAVPSFRDAIGWVAMAAGLSCVIGEFGGLRSQMARDADVEPMLDLCGQIKYFDSHRAVLFKYGARGDQPAKPGDVSAPEINIGHCADRFQYLSVNIP